MLNRVRIHRVVEPHLDRLGCLRPQVLHGILTDETSVFDQADAICHSLHFVEFVGREKDRPAGSRRLPEQLFELVLHQGVEARGRLIEDEKRGLVHEGHQDSDLLAVTFGEVPDAAAEIQVEPVCKVVGANGVGQIASSSHPLQLVADSRASDEGQLARQVTDEAMYGQTVAVGVESEQSGTSCCRALEVEEKPNGRGLAGTVRSEEPEDLSRFDPQVEIPDGRGPPECLGKPRGLYHWTLLRRWRCVGHPGVDCSRPEPSLPRGRQPHPSSTMRASEVQRGGLGAHRGDTLGHRPPLPSSALGVG